MKHRLFRFFSERRQNMFDPELYKRFDQTVARENTECEKWDDRASFGSACALPMWVADMDFETVPEVIAALRERVQHGVFGYSMPTGRDKDALINWLKRRHAADFCAEDVLFSPGVVDSIYHALVALFAPGSKIVVQRRSTARFSRCRKRPACR